MVQILDIDATGHNVSGDNHVDFAFAEFTKS